MIAPARYGIAPFVMTTYTHEMLAASKVMAVMSANRNVPRDVYDLNDLLTVNPESILAARVNSEDLLAIKDRVLDKICAIDFGLAQQELLPYLPPDQRDAITQQRWEEMTLNVAQTVQRWATNARQIGTTNAGEQ